MHFYDRLSSLAFVRHRSRVYRLFRRAEEKRIKEQFDNSFTPIVKKALETRSYECTREVIKFVRKAPTISRNVHNHLNDLLHAG